MDYRGVHSVLVTSAENKLLGIVTTRDIRFVAKGSLVKDFMTPREKLIVAQVPLPFSPSSLSFPHSHPVRRDHPRGQGNH